MKASLQIKNGTYQVVIGYQDDDGKRKTKWVSTGLKDGTGKRKLEDVKKTILQEFEEERAKRLYAIKPEDKKDSSKERSGYMFTKYLEMWLETIRPNISQTTYTGYAKNIRKIKSYFKDDIPLGELKPIDIQNFYNEMYKEGLSGNTVKHLHANIHKALAYAVKTDLIPTNPSEKTERPKCESFTAQFYNQNEITKLLKTFEGDRMELCVHIAAYYGLRRSEIVGLKWDAINFEQKTITIKRKVINNYLGNGEIIICEDKLKNAASRRTLPLIPHIEKMLIEEKKRQEYFSKIGGSSYNHDYDDYVCKDAIGNLITPNYITDHFRNMIKKYHLRKIRFHDLRHSCASLLLGNGIQMKQIQEWLGHSTYNVTANFYSHLEYNSKIESADVISTVLG